MSSDSDSILLRCFALSFTLTTDMLLSSSAVSAVSTVVDDWKSNKEYKNKIRGLLHEF